MVSSNISTESDSNELAKDDLVEQQKRAARRAEAIPCLAVTPETVESVRAQLDPIEPDQEPPDDSMIIRFIRATGGNIPQVGLLKPVSPDQGSTLFIGHRACMRYDARCTRATASQVPSPLMPLKAGS